MTLALLELRVIPVGTETSSFSSSVSEAVRYIQDQGLKYQVTPTSTVIEGDLDQLFQTAKTIHQNVFRNNGANRVITEISIDERIDKPMDMDQQVQTVQQSVNH